MYISCSVLERIRLITRVEKARQYDEIPSSRQAVQYPLWQDLYVRLYKEIELELLGAPSQ